METNEIPKSYPMFKDRIDEYLWKEHHILGGCCSSVECVKYDVAREVAEKLTDAFIEKAWDWIEDNILSSNQQDKSRLYYEQFKNYMKGE